MNSKKRIPSAGTILFFADRKFPLIGGVEAHADAFIKFFDERIIGIVSERKEWKKYKDPSVIFFNSGFWVEEMREIRSFFPKSKIIYRTGGNEIIKADLSQTVISSHRTRQKFWTKAINESVDLMITNSKFTEKRLRTIGVETEFLLVNGGVDANALRSTEPVNQTVRFFCAARFVPYKNHLLLISIFEELYLKGYRFNLRLAGDGPLLEKTKTSVVNCSNCIDFLGKLNHDQVYNEMKLADVYIQLSSDYTVEVEEGSYIHTEGMGRSFLEAITAGLFIIAGRCGALDEIVDENRGILADLENRSSLLKSIESIIKIRPRRGEWTSDYRWENVFNAYETAFSDRKI